MKVGIIDYGAGNIGSLVAAVEKLALQTILIKGAVDLPSPDVLILPGVGDFTHCKRLLDAGGWTDALRKEVIQKRKPILGICVGMQLLASHGFEGTNNGSPTEGLGFIPGKIVSLRSLNCQLRLPHVGWNSILISGNNSLLDGISDGTDFYFVHNYGFVPESEGDLLATVEYDIKITAIVNRGNIWGTQFHPEKSSQAGLKLLRNFTIHHRRC